MKPVYKTTTVTLNRRNDYTPIHVVKLSRVEDRRKNPYCYLQVSINLVHGTVNVETENDNGLTIHPFSSRHISITRP